MTDWDSIYAHLVTATGWSWDRIDAMTIPRYRALARYWEQYPPTHLLLRALTKFKPSAAAPTTSDVSPFAGLAALAPSGTLNLAGLARV